MKNLNLLRYADQTETTYLQQLAKADAWSSLNQWLFPTLALIVLASSYWVYRPALETLLQNTNNPEEYHVLISFVLKFFVVLLHIALLAYLVKLQRILRYFRKSTKSSNSADHVAIAHNHTGLAISEQWENLGIYRVEGKPSSILNLVVTSRSGLRRYRWHYYCADLPLTPLPLQRKILPIHVQKKSWENLAKYDLEQLSEVFPDKVWLDICKQDSKISIDVVKVEYYGFHFFYLCALDMASPALVKAMDKSTDKANITALCQVLPCTTQDYRLGLS